jgi:hypothetical protein
MWLQNAAFAPPHTSDEIARILRDVAVRIERADSIFDSPQFILFDVNGNEVGFAIVTGPEPESTDG